MTKFAARAMLPEGMFETAIGEKAEAFRSGLADRELERLEAADSFDFGFQGRDLTELDTNGASRDATPAPEITARLLSAQGGDDARQMPGLEKLLEMREAPEVGDTFRPDAGADHAAWATTAAGQGGGRNIELRYPGIKEVFIEHDGLQRSFIIDVPADFDPARSDAYSAVMVFHGKGGQSSNMVKTGFSEAGEDGDFIAIYANAVDGRWNKGNGTGPDDVGFVQVILNQLITNWNVDSDQVFAAGVSNGGMFTQVLASQAGDHFAAFGVINANLPKAVGDADYTGSDQPMVIFHGTEDRRVPFEGKPLANGNTGPGAEDMVAYWAENNSTTMGAYQQLPDTANDGMTNSVRYSDDGTIEHYVTEGGGHAWPGLSGGKARSLGPTQDINATDIIVDFFSDYGL